MDRRKPLRENVRSTIIKNWSRWFKAMVPSRFDGVKNRAPGKRGYLVRAIERSFPDEARRCGIYEWKAEKPGRRSVVVYVGSTCRAKSGALRARINEYSRHGSHKYKLINDALRRGYTLLVRVKVARSRKKAEELENALLDRYDYAWNERRNEDIRHILE